MTDQDIVNQLVSSMANAAATGAAGVVSVSIDGVSTTYNWDQAQRMLEFWERRLARSSGKRRLFSTMDLRGV